jgi:hypothetical protein
LDLTLCSLVNNSMFLKSRLPSSGQNHVRHISEDSNLQRQRREIFKTSLYWRLKHQAPSNYQLHLRRLLPSNSVWSVQKLRQWAWQSYRLSDKRLRRREWHAWMGSRSLKIARQETINPLALIGMTFLVMHPTCSIGMAWLCSFLMQSRRKALSFPSIWLQSSACSLLSYSLLSHPEEGVKIVFRNIYHIIRSHIPERRQCKYLM